MKATTTTIIPNERQAVAEAAYRMWEQDGRPNGRDMDYWLKAEQLLSAKRQLSEIRASNNNTSDGKYSGGRKQGPARAQARA